MRSSRALVLAVAALSGAACGGDDSAPDGVAGAGGTNAPDAPVPADGGAGGAWDGSAGGAAGSSGGGSGAGGGAGATAGAGGGGGTALDAAKDAPEDGGPPACDQGGQTAGSSGFEAPAGEAVVGLCRMALGCPAIWQLAPPPAGYKNSGTPNHKLLWRVWNYGWARKAGTAAEIADARSFLADFFGAQVTYGHYAISNGADEVLTTSHYQIWTNGMTCARLLAVVYADTTLLDATGGWWRGEKALYDLLERGGSIDAPGARFKPGQAGPSNLRDTIYAMIRGTTLPGKAKDPKAAWWSDYYNVAAWTLREVFRLGDDLGGAKSAGPGDVPKLHDPLYLHVKGDDFVFVFPKLRAALEPLFWVARIGGTTSYAPYASGTPQDSPYPPPALPGATTTVVPGVGP